MAAHFYPSSPQCITVPQQTTRYPFVYYSALFLCTFSVFHCGNSYFFMLHYFHVAPFCLVIFSCCIPFMLCTISCCTFTRCNVLVLYSSPVALFACCNFFLLHFHVALFAEVQSVLPETSKMESFATIINKSVDYCCNALHLRCSWGSWLRLYYFHVAPFSCCTL